MRRKDVPDITERIEGKAGFSEVFVNVCLIERERERENRVRPSFLF